MTAVENDRVWVEKAPESGCDGCSQKKGCSTTLLEQFIKKHPLEVETTLSLGRGDRVIIGVDEQALISNSLLIYLSPLLVLFVSAIVAQGLADYFHFQSSEGLSIISGLFGFFVCLSFIRQSSNHSAKHLQLKPVVLRKS